MFWFPGFLVFAACVALYFLPSLIGSKKRNAAAIFILNLLLGWTVVGWVVALVWALTVETPMGGMPQAPMQQVPMQQVPVQQAWVCSRCGTGLQTGDRYCPACGNPTGR